MKFKITATSGLVKDVHGFDPDKFNCHWGEVKHYTVAHQDITHIEIDTVEELIALSECCEIIVNGDRIEVYNNYRE